MARGQHPLAQNSSKRRTPTGNWPCSKRSLNAQQAQNRKRKQEALKRAKPMRAAAPGRGRGKRMPGLRRQRRSIALQQATDQTRAEMRERAIRAQLSQVLQTQENGARIDREYGSRTFCSTSGKYTLKKKNRKPGEKLGEGVRHTSCLSQI